MEIRNIEFTALPDGEVEIRQVGSSPYVLADKHREFVSAMHNIIRDRWPIAYRNLSKRYESSQKNKRYHEFMMVRGFIKCNMGAHDNRVDVDENGNFQFEFCQCPRAGECPEWKETCEPKENLDISDGEIRVLRLIAQGKQSRDIADALCISPKTVENHTNNMLRKLNVHNNASLVTYFHQKNLK